MPVSEKMTNVTGTSKSLYIPEDVYRFLVSILDEGVPNYDEPLADHIRHSVLSEIKTKVDHAYNKTRGGR